jgi:hypothetical protein
VPQFFCLAAVFFLLPQERNFVRALDYSAAGRQMLAVMALTVSTMWKQ